MAVDYKAIFRGVANAKPINNFAPRLGVGRYQVALSRYGVKDSQQNLGAIIEAEFVVTETGERRGWPWFVGSQGWAGAYEEDRAKTFLKTIAESLGSEEDLDVIGAALASDEQQGRGIILDVEVTPQLNKDGSQRVNKKNEPLFNATWFAMAQSLEDVAAMRAKLDEHEKGGGDTIGAGPAAAPPAKTVAPAPVTTKPATLGGAATTATTTPPKPAGLGLFGRK